MIPVRSRRIFGPVVLAAGTRAVVYTVPSGRTAIFRSLLFVNVGAAGAACQLRVNADTTAACVSFMTIGSLDTVALRDDLILNPGDVLWAGAPFGATVNLSGYGSLLDGAPS